MKHLSVVLMSIVLFVFMIGCGSIHTHSHKPQEIKITIEQSQRSETASVGSISAKNPEHQKPDT